MRLNSSIRVPPTVSLGALLDKVRDRLGSDVTQLRYREEGGGAAGSGAQFVGLRDDEELERAVGVAEQRLRRGPIDEVAERRVAGMLARRGFSSSIGRRAIEVARERLGGASTR